MRTLDELRPIIQELDNTILEALNKRMEAVIEVGEYKKAHNLPVYAPEVEQRKMNQLSEKEEYEGMVKAIWPSIMDFAKTLE